MNFTTNNSLSVLTPNHQQTNLSSIEENRHNKQRLSNNLKNSHHSRSFDVFDHLDRIQIVKETSREYHCKCPVCGDGGFKIDKETGKYNAFKCGCDLKDIREAIRPWSEVLEESGATQKAVRPKQYREWIYQDRQGNPFIKVCRTDDGRGKTKIWQQHWDGSQWRKGYGNVKREEIPIYRYQEIRQAIARGEPIFVVEGESCADALWEKELAATTNIGGAGKWLESHTEDLSGAQLVILAPDRDKPGIKHMEEIASQLPQSTEVKWLYCFPASPLWRRMPPNKGLDVVDWLEEGATLEDVLDAIENSPRVFESVNHEPEEEDKPKLISMEKAAERARKILIQGGSELSVNFELERIRRLTDLSSSFWERKVIAPLKREVGGDRFKADLKLILQEEDKIEQVRQIAQLASRYQMSSGAIKSTLEIMRAQVTTPEVKALSLVELFNLESTGLDWLVPEFIPKGETIILSASPKAGKTLLAIDIAFGVVTGEDLVLGQTVSGGKKVLIVECDESPQSTKSKLLRRGFRERDAELVRVLTSWNMSQLPQLEAYLEDFRPDLVIVDSLRRINHGSEISENSAEFADNIYTLKETLQRYGASGILIHHSNKDSEALGVNKLRGSSAIAGAVWGTITLDHIPKPDPNNKKKLIIDPRDPKRVLNLHARDSEGQSLQIELNPENNSWSVTGEVGIDEAVQAERESLRQQILNVLTVNPEGLGGRDIVMCLGAEANKGSVFTTLNRLVNKKVISSKPAPGDRRYTIYFLPDLGGLVENSNTDENKTNTLTELHNPPPPPPSDQNVIYFPEAHTQQRIRDRQHYITLDNKLDNTPPMLCHLQSVTNDSNTEPVKDVEIDNNYITTDNSDRGGCAANPVEGKNNSEPIVNKEQKLQVGDRVTVKVTSQSNPEGEIIDYHQESGLWAIKHLNSSELVWYGQENLVKLRSCTPYIKT